MHRYPSPQILYMGKESSFLPLAMQSYPSPQILPHMGKSQAFCRQNAKLSFPTSHSILCREGFFPIMQNFYKSFPTNLYFFFLHFSFNLYLFIFYFILLFFSYFLKFLFNFLFLFAKLEILPQSEKIFPSIWGNNRRIDALEGTQFIFFVCFYFFNLILFPF